MLEIYEKPVTRVWTMIDT